MLHKSYTALIDKYKTNVDEMAKENTETEAKIKNTLEKSTRFQEKYNSDHQKIKQLKT